MNESLDLKRQLESHLNCLRAAGIEWLPRGPKLEIRESPAAAASVSELEETKAADAPVDDRRVSLQLLADEVKKCMRCPELASSRTQTVFSDGDPGAELVLVGEAPGADEDREGLPFVGAAGQLLNKILAACGLRREDVYICNILKCRPPGNRTPLPNEAENCIGYLSRQLEILKPKFILCLGSSAAKYLLRTTQSLGALRRKFHDYQGAQVMVTYHPSYLLPHRDPSKKKDVWEDMKMLMARMGREIPPR